MAKTDFPNAIGLFSTERIIGDSVKELQEFATLNERAVKAETNYIAHEPAMIIRRRMSNLFDGLSMYKDFGKDLEYVVGIYGGKDN